MPKGTSKASTKTGTKAPPSADAYDWQAAVTKAHVGLEVAQASGGALARKVVIHDFEFDMDQLMEVYRSNLIAKDGQEAERSVSGLGINVEEAHWKVWLEYCTGVQRYQGMEDLTLAQMRKVFGDHTRLKKQAIEATMLLVQQLQTTEAKLAGPLSIPAS